LEAIGLGGGVEGLGGIGEVVETMGVDVGVVAEELADGGLGGWGEEVETEPGSADVVGLFDDEAAMGIVAGDGCGEGEGEEETEESEDGSFNDGEAGASALAPKAPRPKAPASRQRSMARKRGIAVMGAKVMLDKTYQCEPLFDRCVDS